MNLNRLEQYLDELEAPLARLAPAERAGWRDEARQHLLAIVEARVELGASPEEAVAAALAQFGEPKRLGREMALAARRSQDRAASLQLAASTHAVCWNTGVLIAALRVLFTGSEVASGEWGRLLGTLLGAGLVLFAGQCLGGAALGWFARRKSLGPGVVIPYLGLILSGLLATGTLSSFGLAEWLVAAVPLLGSLAAGSRCARLACDRRDREAARSRPALPAG